MRAARGFVRWCPRELAEARCECLVQIPLTVLAVAFVLLAWVVATFTLLVSSLGGSASARY